MTTPSRKKKEKAWTVAGAAEKREKLLRLVADGMKVETACQLLGHNLNWYVKARDRHPEWAQRVTAARLARRDPDLPGIDFIAFRKTYFGNTTAPHHYRMVEAFETAPEGSMTAVLAWPGAGKSTTLVDKYCHLLAKDPNLRICVISEGQQLSRNLIGQVQDRMEDSQRFPEYHLAYGPFKQRAWDDSERTDREELKRSWNADYFRILKANADQKDPSLASFGATSRIYGARFDWMIYDDIQSNETIGNTDKYLRSMRTSWSSRTNLGAGKRGRQIMIGSRVGVGDIYERMDELGMIDNLITIPVLTMNIPQDEHYVRRGKKIIANPSCAAQPTWASQSLQELAEIRAFVGEEVWARTYMQDIVLDGAAVFTEEMLEAAKDRTRVLGPAPVGMERWGSLDPALDSGVAAYLMTAVSPDKLWVLDCMGRTDTYTYQDSFDWINTWSSRYRPSKWIVEQNNFQKGLMQDDRLLSLGSRWGFEPIAHQTHRNKNDPVMGIRMMANAFASGEISIPWGDETTIELMQPLVDELRTWKPRVRGAAQKMDRVMTLWFTWMHWQNERDAMNNVIPLMPRPSWSGGRKMRLA